MSADRALLSLAAAWVAAIAGAPEALAAVAQASGQILSVQGPHAIADGWIERTGSPRIALRDYGLLLPGDRVVARHPGLKVSVMLQGEARPRTVTVRAVLLLPPPGHGPQASAGASAFLESVSYLFESRPRPITVYTQARDQAAAVPPSPLAPPGDQLIPEGATRMAVIWSPSAATLRIRADQGAQPAATRRLENWAAFAPPEGSDFTVSLDRGPRWRVRRTPASQVPTPPWGAPMSEADRVARAAWLLETPEHAAWRLFALGELNTLAETNYLAARLWQAAVTGEWPAKASGTPG